MRERKLGQGRQFIWEEEEYKKLIEPGIRNLVKSLHSADVDTFWSCEGHIREYPWHVGILPWPWVIVYDTSTRVTDLAERIAVWNQEHPGEEWILSESQTRIHPSLTPRYIRNILLRELPGSVVKALCPVDENPEFSAEKLQTFQAQVSPLALFIEGR